GMGHVGGFSRPMVGISGMHNNVIHSPGSNGGFRHGVINNHAVHVPNSRAFRTPATVINVRDRGRDFRHDFWPNWWWGRGIWPGYGMGMYASPYYGGYGYMGASYSGGYAAPSYGYSTDPGTLASSDYPRLNG